MKPNIDSELKSKLTKEQYNCTQCGGTEPAFQNAYWNHHEDGIYVDVVGGQALFLSLDNFDSGTGWPSFMRPIADGVITEHLDDSLGMRRTEIRSQQANSHLGHVFSDGPRPTGLRYCVNSAALNFVPLRELKSQGYGRYLFAFADKMGWQIATFAGGCFWGMERLMSEVPGVIETQVGYAGGNTENATYEQVRTGRTLHAESVQILFDPTKLNFENLLLYFFKIHDPTTLNRQGNDIGSQYRSMILCRSEEQKQTAENTIRRVNESGQWKNPVVTEVRMLKMFVRAEEEHQKYLEKYPDGYTCHFVRNLKF